MVTAFDMGITSLYSMRRAAITRLSVGANVVASMVMLLVVSTLAGRNLYEFGPSPRLVVLTVVVDTTAKYLCIVLGYTFMSMIDVVVNDIGSPNLGFSIYDPTRTVIYGFTRVELEVLANLQWAASGLIQIFRVMILVARFDISIISFIASQLTSIVVVHYLLNRKSRFVATQDYQDVVEELA